MPTITCSGRKLPLAFINRSKTDKFKNKMNIPNNMHAYWSTNGWVNESIMLYYLDEIIKPNLSSKGGALVLDEFAAHWTPKVVDKADQMKLRLIKVPAGQTSTLQPLDISCMGPMSKTREKLYMEMKMLKPDEKDNVQNAIQRANEAYKQLDSHTIVKGWKQICDLL